MNDFFAKNTPLKNIVCGDEKKKRSGHTGYDLPGHFCQTSYDKIFSRFAVEPPYKKQKRRRKM